LGKTFCVGRIHWLPTQCYSWVGNCPPCPLGSRAFASRGNTNKNQLATIMVADRPHRHVLHPVSQFDYIVVYVGLNCLKNLRLSLLSGVPHFFFRTTPLDPTGSQIRHLLLETHSSTSQLRSNTFLLGSNTLQSLYFSIFSVHDVLKKCSPSRLFCHLHLSVLGVDRCCKRQTLLKCHKSETQCLEYSKIPGRRSRIPPLLSALRARASALQASF